MSLPRCLYLACSIGLLSFGSVVQAVVPPPAYVIDNFDSSAEVNNWAQWPNWGDTPVTYAFDSSMDAGGTVGSGSMKVTVTFPGPDSDAGFALARPFNGTIFNSGVGLPTADFSSFSMDVRYDPGSATTGFGTFGLLFCMLTDTNWGLGSISAIVTPVGTTGWTHVVLPVSSLTTSDNIGGFMFYMYDGYSPSDQNYIAGTETFWLDNLELTYVPEPSSSALLWVGAALFMAARGFRRNRLSPCSFGRRRIV